MSTAKWTINTGEQEKLHFRAPRFNENGCLHVWCGDALISTKLTCKKISLLRGLPIAGMLVALHSTMGAKPIK